MRRKSKVETSSEANKSRICDFMDGVKKKLLWSPPTIESLDPVDLCVDDRAMRIYDGLFSYLIEYENKSRREAYEGLLCIDWGSYRENPDEWMRDAAIIELSISQRRKNPAGKSIEDIVCYFLKKMSIECKTGVGYVDVTAYGKVILRIDCKQSSRDRTNDKDDDVHIYYFAEISKKTYQHFASKNAVLIIINPDERAKAFKKISKLEINLPVYSFSDGLEKIKELL